MNKDNLIEFAKEQSVVFPEDSAMGWYLRETLRLLQAEPCEDAVSRQVVAEFLRNHANDFSDVKVRMAFKAASSLMENADNVPPVKSTQRWVPVSERLPKPYTFVNATCRSLVDDREDWVVETMYLPIPKEDNIQSYSDWGNIPILNWGKAEVIAWMERKIPEPYKKGEESKEV